MKIFGGAAVRALACAVVMLAAACGGGDSGGSASFDDAYSSVPQPRRAFYDASPTPGMGVILSFGGDLEWLYEQDLYIYVLYPEPVVFGEDIELSSGPDPATQLYVSIPGVASLPVGTYSGELEIHACLDESCERELENSPRMLEYTVEILDGMRIAQSEVNVSAPFGTAPDGQQVDLTLPEGAMGLGVGDWQYRYGIYTSTSMTPAPHVTLDFIPQPVGLHEWTFHIGTMAPDPAGEYAPPRSFSAPLTVRYEVTPNPGVPIALTRTRTVYRVVYGDCREGFTDFELLHQDPEDAAPIATELFYGAYPPEAEDHEGRTWWVQGVTNGYMIDPCHFSRMPPGTYTATLRYTRDRNGPSPYAVEHALELIIEP